MITDRMFDSLTNWFDSHADSFTSADPGHQFNLTLKKEHTYRVIAETGTIGAAIGMPAQDLAIARSAALLHDVGRFEQYARYHTFVDRKSVDHALLAIDLIRRAGVLKPLNAHDRDLVLCAIEQHNKPAVPGSLPESGRFFCNLLRDADKLDIMGILASHYRCATQGAESAVKLLLPQGEGISPDVLADLMAGNAVKFSYVKTANDFTLVQMSWVFDINFAPSLRLFQERGYLEAFRDALPNTDAVRMAYTRVKAEMEKRIRELPCCQFFK